MTDAARALLSLLLAALWQDVLVALVAYVLLALAGRRLNAATRYAVLQCALVAMVAVLLLTVFSHAAPHVPGSGIGTVPALGPAAHAAANAASGGALHRTDVSIASSDALVLAIAGGWLAGVLAFASRIVAGAWRLSRLAARSTRLADRGRARLLASPVVTMPLAFGLFVPTVVVPAELAERGGDDVECVILHELAHLRRGDAWANAWERLVQAVLFFDPAVWLVLRAIAFEREAACDDWAVAQSGDADGYARSLASFALRAANRRTLVACNLAGFGRTIFARLRRLEDARRNGTVTVTVTRFALGGFTLVLVMLAVGIQLLAPPIALAAHDRAVATVTAPDPCARIVKGPPFPSNVPPGLRTDVEIRVSSRGTVSSPTVIASSGNARFDRIMAADARQMLVAIGKTVPPHCNAPLADTYRMSLESGVRTGNDANGIRMTTKSDRMEKPVTIIWRAPHPTGR